MILGSLVSRFAAGALVATALAAPAWETLQPDGFVTDAARVLQAEEERALEADLEAYRRETSNEFAVVILPSLEETPIEDVAIAIGRRWGAGTRDRSNGLLFLGALQEREVRIEVGYGLEGAVPDAIAKRIIEDEIVPKFRDGAYADGIRAGVTALKAAIGGEYRSRGKNERAAGKGLAVWWVLLALLYALLRFVVVLFARTRSWWLGGVLGAGIGTVLWLLLGWTPLVILALGSLFLFLDFLFSRWPPRGVVSGRGWWLPGGWGRGRSGGGGFGGGSFGGGGASGKW